MRKSIKSSAKSIISIHFPGLKALFNPEICYIPPVEGKGPGDVSRPQKLGRGGGSL